MSQKRSYYLFPDGYLSTPWIADIPRFGFFPSSFGLNLLGRYELTEEHRRIRKAILFYVILGIAFVVATAIECTFYPPKNNDDTFTILASGGLFLFSLVASFIGICRVAWREWRWNVLAVCLLLPVAIYYAVTRKEKCSLQFVRVAATIVIVIAVVMTSEELRPSKQANSAPPPQTPSSAAKILVQATVIPNAAASQYEAYIKSSMDREAAMADLIASVRGGDNEGAQRLFNEFSQLAANQNREAEAAARRPLPDAAEKARIDKMYAGRIYVARFRKDSALRQIKQIPKLGPEIAASFENVESTIKRPDLSTIQSK